MQSIECPARPEDRPRNAVHPFSRPRPITYQNSIEQGDAPPADVSPQKHHRCHTDAVDRMSRPSRGRPQTRCIGPRRQYPSGPAPVKRQRNPSACTPARGRGAALGARPDAVDRVSSRPEDGHETRCIRFTPRPNPRTRNVILRRRPPAYAAAGPHVSPREIRRCLRVHAPPLQPASAAERIVQRLVRSAVRCRHRRLGIRESFRSKTSGPP